MNRIEQINAYTVEEIFPILLSRILDISNFEDVPYMLDTDLNMPFYDRIIMHENLVKPEESRLNTELAEYKAELIAEENARLAELARVQDITDRFNAMTNIRAVLNHFEIEMNNPHVELKRIVADNDQAALVALEAKFAEYSALSQSEESKKDKIEMGRKVRELSSAILDLVAGYNIERQLTVAQIDSMESSFGPILQALSVNRVDKAKALIEDMTVDGTLFTQDMKVEILGMYAANGL